MFNLPKPEQFTEMIEKNVNATLALAAAINRLAEATEVANERES